MFSAHIRVDLEALEIHPCNSYILYMMITDALEDLKNLALSGKTLDFAEVAADYGLNPKLLERKFHESYPNGVVALKSSADLIKEQLADKIAFYCKRYGIDAPLVGERSLNGKRYVVICADRAKRKRPWVAVSLDDARGYLLAKFDN